MKKKIWRLNKLDLKREGNREPSDHLIYPRELGCRCKSPAGRTLKDKLSETGRKAKLGRLATEWTAHRKRTSARAHARTHTHTHSVTSWTKARQGGTKGVPLDSWSPRGRAGGDSQGWGYRGPENQGNQGNQGGVCHVFKAPQSKDGLEICQQEQIMAWTLVTKMMVIYGNLLVRLSFLILF